MVNSDSWPRFKGPLKKTRKIESWWTNDETSAPFTESTVSPSKSKVIELSTECFDLQVSTAFPEIWAAVMLVMSRLICVWRMSRLSLRLSSIKSRFSILANLYFEQYLLLGCWAKRVDPKMKKRFINKNFCICQSCRIVLNFKRPIRISSKLNLNNSSLCRKCLNSYATITHTTTSDTYNCTCF